MEKEKNNSKTSQDNFLRKKNSLPMVIKFSSSSNYQKVVKWMRNTIADKMLTTLEVI